MNHDLHGRFPKGFILKTLLPLNQTKMAYGIQSPPRQSSSSVYSLYLGAEGKSHWRGGKWVGMDNHIESVL